MNQSSGLLFARGQKNISLTGFGTIDGQGGNESFQFGNDADGGPKRPKIIYLVECQGIVVTDLTLRNSAYWVQHYERCEDVTIRGLKVFSHCNYNNDGLDIDAKNATIPIAILMWKTMLSVLRVIIPSFAKYNGD